MHSIKDIIRALSTFLAVTFLLTCCQKIDRADGQYPEGDATLSVAFSIPEINVGTRSISSDPSDPSGWTAWEKAVDGRYLYRVTAFLLRNDRLVSSKDIKLTGEESETVLEFDGNFTHGTYKLMAVANYSAHQAEDGSNGMQSYDGLTDFTSTVESILEQGTIENFTSAYGDSFIRYELSSADGICSRTPQALTMVKDIELHPGTNTIEGELLRTYSRIRITAENQSDEELKISSLSFCDIFTQRRAYLFDGNGYIQDRVSPDVDSPDALVRFTATTDTPLAVAAKESRVIFDAYILESSKNSIDEEYSYTLNLGYDGTGDYKLGSTTAINRKSGVTKGSYLIYNTNSGRYLTAGSNSVQTGTLSSLTAGMTVPEEYVWTFDNSGLSSGHYHIGTSEAMTDGETAYYMDDPSSSSVYLVPSKSVSFYLDETSVWSNKQWLYYLTLRSDGNDRYLRVSNNTASGRNSVNNTTYFYLYPVEKPSGSASSFNIPLETIDNTTGQPEMVGEIRRNDFINVIVLVRYNKNKGHFEFEVKNWESAGGDVEFN